MVIFLYILFYLFALYAESFTVSNRRYWLMATCIVLAYLAGVRDMSWSDTDVYVYSFNHYTPSIGELNEMSKPFGYSEMGFYYIGVVVKTFTSDATIYLLVVAALSMFFLYKAFDKYCYYPLFGVCAYIARFYTARNFIQIRAGLSYAMILWAVQYITKKDWKRYFLWILIAYQFHHSAVLAIPLYFLCMVKVKRWHILLGIIIAFILGGVYTEFMRGMVEDYVNDINTATTYIGKEYQREWGLGNPVIYFQLAILFLYTIYEKVLISTSEDYYTMRTAYFYSTFILISCSMYTALSGRTSSMFATLEMAIIPTIINTFYKKNRWIAYLCMGAVLSTIFYMNEYIK